MATDDGSLAEAIENGNAAAIEKRLRSDASFANQRDKYGDTPLLTAIGLGKLEIVNLFLEHGSNPNAAGDDGYTCLLTAIESDAPQSIIIVDRLIKAGADIHETGMNGWTPLHMAAARGQVSKMQVLIHAGADVNRRTHIDGSVTPLIEAAYFGQPIAVRLLLQRGADCSVRDQISGRTALEKARYALEGPDPDVIKGCGDNVDLRQAYVKAAKHNVDSGNHLEVIRLLEENRQSRANDATEIG